MDGFHNQLYMYGESIGQLKKNQKTVYRMKHGEIKV